MSVPIRSDIVDVYVFRRVSGAERYEFLQLLRRGPRMSGTWHPVMGHMDAQERADETARREVLEEVGLRTGSVDCLRFFALEQIHPYFIPDMNCIVMSPRFAAEVSGAWVPALNDEHSEYRWIAASQRHLVMWPGQRACIAEICEQ